MNLPVGYDNFGKVIENKLDFVDKSLFIKEVIDDISTEVAVIVRPRRFGKTLNLSMLHHFLSAEIDGKPTQPLFDGLKILSAGEKYQQHQGRYPVIFVTLKDVKDQDYSVTYRNFCRLMSHVYLQHQSVLSSPKLSSHQKRVYESILEEKGSVTDMQSSLFNLTHVLYLHHGIKPWLLIDEYDTPIQVGYVRGYYNEIIGLMRSLLGQSLKSNPYLHRSVITGILRVSKESIFSGVNNLEMYTLLRREYAQHFGFTEEEVSALLRSYDLEKETEVIKEWYNGYQIGGTTTIYNPWSMTNCLKRGGEVGPYWVNTSDNQLIRDLLVSSSGRFKSEFQRLLEGGRVDRIVDEHMVFEDLRKSESGVWSLMLMTGYLKVSAQHREDQGLWCTLEIPNREVRNLYRQIIEQWLSNGYGIEWYNTFLNHLLTGNLKAFERELLVQVMESTISSHDMSRDPEAFYHGLMIGLTASLYQSKNYEIRSNRESGYGRYDYMILSQDKSKPTLLLEFKRVDTLKDEERLMTKLEETAREAVKQISKSRYVAEAENRGNTNIIKIGLAFCGKRFKIQAEQNGRSLIETASESPKLQG
ncbi:MAG: AAA family ATPase [Proteobacteria bacterium]|nr:AAA family ATPase [Pseudomonadota bacterium]